jgi:hypothetical protein
VVIRDRAAVKACCGAPVLPDPSKLERVLHHAFRRDAIPFGPDLSGHDVLFLRVSKQNESLRRLQPHWRKMISTTRFTGEPFIDPVE